MTESMISSDTHTLDRSEDRSIAGYLIDPDGLATLLGVNKRTILYWKSAKKLPREIKIRSSVRWRRSEVLAWIEALCPDQQAWEARRGELISA